MRRATLVLCMACTSAFFPLARADTADANLAKRCPGAARWERTHGHQGGAPAKVSEPSLRAELLRREALDQKVRNNDLSTAAAREAARRVDANNLAWIKRLITGHGFPHVSEVGRNGVDAAWILVQHASDHAFQSSVLKLIAPRLGRNEITGEEYALLTDRVSMFQHKPQIYGSQFRWDHKKLVMYEVEDPAHLDERRASMGMMPESDYACELRTSP